MRVVVVLSVVGLAGCLVPELVDCGDGRACPKGTMCTTFTLSDEQRCIDPADLAACDGKAEYDPCDAAEPSACYPSTAGLICQPGGCGNGLIDPDEVCDDQNGANGDGCSYACKSLETCGNGFLDPIRTTNGVTTTNEECDSGDGSAFDGCTPTCRLENPRWERLDGTFDDRSLPAIAFDLSRGRVVMFGGITGANIHLDDTWEFDGSAWVHVPTIVAPPARAGAVMAYDADRRRTVLFGGGASGNTIFDDTWEWDGATWTRRSTPVAPPKRSSAGAAYDLARKRVVLFGGSQGGMKLRDTWEWDGSTWQEIITTTRPSGRYRFGMAYDAIAGVVIVAGGNGSDGTTWAFDGASWTSKGGSVGGEGVAITAHPTGLLAFGGTDPQGNLTSDAFYRWDGAQWIELVVGGLKPAHRRSATFIADPLDGASILFGGHWIDSTPSCPGCAGDRNDIWHWDGTVWNQIYVSSPGSLAYAASTIDTHRGRTIVFGGIGDFQAVGTVSNDTYELSADGGWLRASQSGPAARSMAAIAFDAARDNTVMFGGRDLNGNAMNSMYTWNGKSWMGVGGGAAVIPPRFGHAMAFDPIRRETIMFGGRDNTMPAVNYFGDTWAWDGTTWTQRTPATSPMGRTLAALAFDPIRGKLVLFGGERPLMTFADTWEWDGTNWTELATNLAPSARAGHGLAWSAARRRIVTFGGATQLAAAVGDTWELEGLSWSQLVVAGPTPRLGHVFAPLPDGSGVVLYGGAEPSPRITSSETWRLRWSGPGPYEACVREVDDDLDGHAGCSDPDCWTRCTPDCPPGVTCPPAAPTCGDGTCSIVETCRLCPGDCGVCADACGDGACTDGETAATCHGDCD